MTTVPEALYQRAAATPDGRAIGGDDGQVTFAELRDQSERMARSLMAAGIEPGDRVAIWAPNCHRWVAASFGVYMCGAALVPLNTRFKSAEAVYVVRASGAAALLGVSDFLDHDFLATARAWDGVPALRRVIDINDDTFLSEGEAVDPEAVRGRVDALGDASISDIMFTSGTTGAPKGAVLTHGASTRTYEAWTDCVGLREGDRCLLVWPFFHTAGLKSGILGCILKGAEIHPFAVFDVDTLMDYVSRHRMSMLPGPPTVFQSILDHPRLAEFDLSSLRLSVTGAAIVPVDVIRRMREELRFENVVTGYGLTETTGTVSMCRHDDPPEIVATTVGKPLPGVEVKVVNDEGKEVPAGDPGELLVRGFNVMKEYFNNAAATDQAIDAEGWFRTGDVGFVGQDGNIRITDRKKDMYISGGFNVYPAEVEGLILRHPGVAQVAVVGIPDTRLGEVGLAVLVLRADLDTFDEADFLQWCRSNMANFKAPRRVQVVESLPLNPSGKVMKFKLRQQAATA